MKINNKEVTEEKIKLLIDAVKSRPDFSGVDDKFVQAELVGFLSHDKKMLGIISEREIKDMLRARVFKELVKLVRAILRRTCGVFQLAEAGERKQLFDELRKNPVSIELHEKILATHLSSAERLNDYESIYQSIFAVTGKPKIVLDLGCGLNPVSLPWMKLDTVEYHASDLNKDDCDFVNEYFAIEKITGKAVQLNLIDLKQDKMLLARFPKADVCFLFKILETIELTKSHRISELLLLAAPARYIVASFATKTAGGDRMRNPRRGWIEYMIVRLGFSFEKFETENEIFYIIKKS